MLRLGLLLSAFLFGLAPALQASAKSVGWHAAAVDDIDAAYRIYRDNHPGYVDPTNPGFRRELARARREGLAAAAHANSYSTYAEALGTFSGVLADGHARLVAKPPNPPGQSLWPGFVTAWRGSSLYVLSGEPPRGVKIGDRIMSCDGKPIRQVIAGRLHSQGMRVKEAGHWWSRSPQAFVDTPTMATAHPTRCLFVDPAGERRLAGLTWRPAPADITERIHASANGERTAIGLTEPRHGIFLIGLSDFHPDEGGVAAYKTLFSDLQRRHGTLEHARAVILDLRWNDGGSSDWPRQTAEALWGEDAVDQQMDAYYRNVQIWWRASRENLGYMVGVEASDRAGGDVESADGDHQIVDGMKAALAAHRPFYVQRSDASKSPKSVASTNFIVPVYVITPGNCASACLDAVDIFTRFPNVKLIGAPTAADSAYLDARLGALPSGHGSVVIPVKIWMHRPRAPGQIYTPAIEVDALDWSTADFLNVVERDLAHR